jgi:AcrR family transcriptional regulator
MAGGGKRSRAKESKREAILASALELFNRNGFRGTSMEAIARRAGLAKGTVYLYFPGKEALFAHLVEENLSRALVERRRLAACGADPVEALAWIWRGLVRSYMENPAFFEQHTVLAGKRTGALQEAHAGLVLDLFRELDRMGRTRLGDPEEMANLYLSALHGVFFFSDRIEDPKALPAFSARMFDALLHGILKSAPR